MRSSIESAVLVAGDAVAGDAVVVVVDDVVAFDAAGVFRDGPLVVAVGEIFQTFDWD